MCKIQFESLPFATKNMPHFIAISVDKPPQCNLFVGSGKGRSKQALANGIHRVKSSQVLLKTESDRPFLCIAQKLFFL